MPQDLQAHYLKDYRPPAYLVDEVELRFDLHPSRTQVEAILQMRRNPAAGKVRNPLALDGRQLELLDMTLDGRTLSAADYQLDDEGLTIPEVPDCFRLETRVAIDPSANEALEGLYRSGGLFCTQCEAQGFRKITFYPDRPDVMARF